MEKSGEEVFGASPAKKSDPNCLWAEERIRSQEEQYRKLIETMNEGFVVRGADGLIHYVNERFSTLVGYSREEMIGRPAEEFLDEENKKTLRDQIAGRMRGGEETYELTLIGKEGRRIPVIVSPRSVFDDEGQFKGSFAAVADVTRLKRAEEELRKSEKKLRLLSSHLLRAHEEEASRISRELHDELGQDLTVMRYQTRFIRRKLRKDQAPLKEACEELLQRLDESMKKIRRLSRELSPYAIQHLGLTASLRHLVEDFGKHTGTRVSLDMENVDNLLPSEAQVNLYRIFREALTNIARHAGADRIDAGIVHQDSRLVCWLEDNGKGFDLRKTKAEGSTAMGLGLITMEERCRILGGTFSIESREGLGTRIFVELPLEQEV